MSPRLLIVAAVGAGAVVLSACSAGSAGHSAPTAAAAKTTKAASRAPAAQAVAAPATHAPASTVPTVAPVNACAHNTHGKLVLVDVSQQHLWLCQGTTAQFTSAVTTGAVDLPYDSTPTGHFVIQQKDRNRTLTLIDGQQFIVKYWIPFEGPLFGFHDASWQTMPFGSQRYRTKGSHGCVHLPLATIRYLYHWAAVGTPVHIRR